MNGSTVASPAEHEGIRNMDQRRQIDVRLTASDQLDEAPIDIAILRLLSLIRVLPS